MEPFKVVGTHAGFVVTGDPTLMNELYLSLSNTVHLLNRTAYESRMVGMQEVKKIAMEVPK